MRARLHLRSWALGLGAATLLLTALGACLLLSRSGHFSFTPPVAHQASFAANTANYPTRLSVAGSQLLNAGGQTVVLKGLMPPDPAVLNSRGKFNRAFVQALRATGACTLSWTCTSSGMWRRAPAARCRTFTRPARTLPWLSGARPPATSGRR